MIITFFSSHMTYDYYLKQPMPMCEIKLNQILHKNPQLINCPNRLIIYLLIQAYENIPGVGQD